MTPLWTSDEIARATGGTASEPFAVTGVSFDSREAEAGHLFVAMKGETMDGHRFVPGAFASGASAALVSQPVDGPHVMVVDAGAALNAMAVAARARTSGKIIGVTGSVGKTGTKEALFAALDRDAPGRAHRSVKSYNNHTGVPLSLARMPADTAFGVFEMGMNHAGELAELTRIVRPHAAIVTAIAPAHREFFDSVEAIADAKGEIFQGLQPGGTAIIPFDSPYRDRLRAAAEPYAARILTFGRGEGADVHAREAMATGGGGTLICAVLPDAELTFTLAPPGDHWVSNAMAVLAAVYAVGGDLPAAGLALAEMPGLPGRGERVTIRVEGGEATLIDESYNANPASMAATIASLGREPGRRVAILGEMRELGAESASYHADLAPILRENGVETLFLVGPAMLSLASELPFAQHFPAVEALIPHVRPAPRDTVLVKGSNGVGLARLVAALKAA